VASASGNGSQRRLPLRGSSECGPILARAVCDIFACRVPHGLREWRLVATANVQGTFVRTVKIPARIGTSEYRAWAICISLHCFRWRRRKLTHHATPGCRTCVAPASLQHNFASHQFRAAKARCEPAPRKRLGKTLLTDSSAGGIDFGTRPAILPRVVPVDTVFEPGVSFASCRLTSFHPKTRTAPHQ